MFIFEAYKLYQLKKIDLKINKLKQQKKSLIQYLTNINMMPVKYNDYIESNVTADVITNNDNEAIDIESNVTADFITNNDNEAIDIESTEIDIRIVSINFEEEHTMVQHGCSVQKIEASTSILEKLPLGENVTLKIHSDDTIEFFKKGNKVA